MFHDLTKDSVISLCVTAAVGFSMGFIGGWTVGLLL